MYYFLYKELENDITISPLGIAFVKSNIRRGIIPSLVKNSSRFSNLYFIYYKIISFVNKTK